MRQSILRLGSVMLFALGIAIAGSSAANAESLMKDNMLRSVEGRQSPGTTTDETWPQFLAQCREQQKSAGMGGGGAAPALSSAAPAPAPAAQPTATVAEKTASRCNAEYAANKAAIKASG